MPGETIALIEAYHDPTLTSDLATFDQAFGLPAKPQADRRGSGAGNVTNSGWALEESMDVEWAHAIAPDAIILVVEAQSQSRQALITAVNAARYTPGVVAISMSWGFSESANEASYNRIFTTPPGHPGITFLAASGDSGFAGGCGMAFGLTVGRGRRRNHTQCKLFGTLPIRDGLVWKQSGGVSRFERGAGSFEPRGGKVPANESRPMSRSMATPIPVFASIRPRSFPAMAPGKSWAGRAWERQPGPQSSPSSTRADI